MEIYYMAQEIQMDSIHLEGWDGAGDGREVQKGKDTCMRFMLRFNRKQQNSVKQLSFNKKILKGNEILQMNRISS